ncbi:hypothetical protein HYW32_01840 [Candidatus Berkelbacteria bacterium]|nr:hypothetical protein [Candidatus Berkelbacteria bacterium]
MQSLFDRNENGILILLTLVSILLIIATYIYRSIITDQHYDSTYTTSQPKVAEKQVSEAQ